MRKSNRTSRTNKPWKDRVLAAIATGSTVTDAAGVAGVGRQTIYDLIERDSAFAKAFDDATEQGTDVLEAEATRRAIDGVREPVIYQGQPTLIGYDENDNPIYPNHEKCVRREMFTIRKPSDTLMTLLLKGRRPKKFRENVDVTSNGKAMQPVVVLRGVSTDDL